MSTNQEPKSNHMVHRRVSASSILSADHEASIEQQVRPIGPHLHDHVDGAVQQRVIATCMHKHMDATVTSRALKNTQKLPSLKNTVATPHFKLWCRLLYQQVQHSGFTLTTPGLCHLQMKVLKVTAWQQHKAQQRRHHVAMNLHVAMNSRCTQALRACHRPMHWPYGPCSLSASLHSWFQQVNQGIWGVTILF